MDNTSVEKIAEYGASVNEPKQFNDYSKPFLTLPPGWNVADIESHLPQPLRKKGSIALASASAFIEYTNRHLDADATVLMADELASRFKAVFNHHGKEAAGWGDHSATYNCPLSPEWKIWTGADGNKNARNQIAFAQFIEDNNLDITAPAAATMLEVSRTLQATTKAAFASAIRLDNGQGQFTYNEEIVGKAGHKGEFKIPEQFTITIPVYLGGPAYNIIARLRYRIKDGELTMWYDLLRPHKYLEDAFKDVKAKIAAGCAVSILDVVSA